MGETVTIQNFTRESVRPGVVFSLRSYAALHMFEGLIAPLVNPGYNPKTWNHRTPLEEYIGQDKDLADDISLTVMDEPFKVYQQTIQGNWRFLHATRQTSPITNPDGMLGFELQTTVDGFQSAGAVPITRRMWYAPRPQVLKEHIGFVRHIAKPRGQH